MLPNRFGVFYQRGIRMLQGISKSHISNFPCSLHITADLFPSKSVGNIWHNIDCQCLDKKSSTGAKSSLGGRDAPGGGVEGEGGGKCQNIMNKMFLAGEVSSSPLTLVLSIFDECEIESDTTKITYRFLLECLFCLNLEPIAIIGRPFDSTLKIKISGYVIFAWRIK